MSTVFNCPNCGGTLDFEQMKGTNCPFCRAVLPHHGRAAEHAALVNNMLAQQMQASNPWLGNQPVQISSQYGAGPPPVAQQTAQAVNNTMKRMMLIIFVITSLIIVATFAIVFGMMFFVAG